MKRPHELDSASCSKLAAQTFVSLEVNRVDHGNDGILQLTFPHNISQPLDRIPSMGNVRHTLNCKVPSEIRVLIVVFAKQLGPEMHFH
jgi:hypothetical protein